VAFQSMADDSPFHSFGQIVPGSRSSTYLLLGSGMGCLRLVVGFGSLQGKTRFVDSWRLAQCQHQRVAAIRRSADHPCSTV